MLRRSCLALALACTLPAVAQSSTPASPNPSATAAPKSAAQPISFVTNAPVHRAAVLTLKAGSPMTNDGYNFNGATDGEKGFVVPLGWRVVINFYNIGTEPHSAIVVERPKDDSVHEQYTVEDAAFPGAFHRIVVNAARRFGGTLDFVASKPGKYYIVCARPKHSMNGQYVTLEVSPTAKEAVWQSNQ